MKFFLTGLICLFSFFAYPLDIPSLTGRVVDGASLLTPQEKQMLEGKLAALEQATGGQMAVLTIPSLEGEPIEDFSIRLAEAWKIGYEGKDNGAIFLISVDDREMRLEIGYGWEGDIPDAKAGNIINASVPDFQQRRYAEGISRIILQVQEAVSGNTPPELSSIRERGKVEELLEVIGAIGFIILFLYLISKGIFVGGFRGGSRGGGGGFGGGGFRGGGGGFGGGGASGRF